MRITIFGATGLLGKALMREWQGDEVVGLGSKDVDIRSQEQVTEAIRLAPSGVGRFGGGLHRR